MTEELQNRPKKIAKLIGLAVAVSLVLGACGTSGEIETTSVELPSLAPDADSPEADGADTDEASGPPTEADADLAMAKYESCLGDLGIDISDFTGGGGAEVQELEVDPVEDDASFDFEEFEAAAAECEAELDDAFGDFEMSPEEQAEFDDFALEMQRCLAEEGLDIDMSSGAFELPADVDFAVVEEAMAACEASLGLNEGSDQ